MKGGAFHGLHNLEVLSLKGNYIGRLENRVFAGISNVSVVVYHVTVVAVVR